jgi:branched-chain amino acid transport system permease protein
MILLYGATLGGVLALIASGFTLIFGVSRILNFAHGAFFMLGAYFALILIQSLGLGPHLSAFIGIALVGGLSVLVYIFIISRIMENEVMAIIVTLAIALIIEQSILLSFGEHGISYPAMVTGVLTIGGVAIPLLRIVILGIAILTIVLLWVFITATRLGKEITAASQDPEGAMLIGLNINKLFVVTMFVSAILAGLGGVLYSQIYAANPFLIMKVLIFAFAIVILGGLGSVKGSILASFIIGFILTAVTTMYGARWSEFISIVIIILILLVRPTGLFGVEE